MHTSGDHFSLHMFYSMQIVFHAFHAFTGVHLSSQRYFQLLILNFKPSQIY